MAGPAGPPTTALFLHAVMHSQRHCDAVQNRIDVHKERSETYGEEQTQT